ncbi:MAG: efflux RND transporter permease subunit [Desulfobacteraceae bacterium]|nr:efflux RND transporter permease subunit [Desulfobacteraceae bacterium]
MKSAIAWFADNHVAANLLMLFLLVSGLIIAFSIKLEVFPETSTDRIRISVVYPGASPAEVEEGVVRRIEEKIAGLTGVKRIDSRAREGFGVVHVEVLENWDLQQLLDDVKAEVDRITTFPAEAEKPLVQEVVLRRQVIQIAVYGEVPETTLKSIAERVKDELTSLPGVTQADLSGLRNPEIHVEISEATLKQYGLTLSQVATLISRNSLDLPAGSVKTDMGEILIRSKGKKYRASDYADIAVITESNGSKVTLGQIAELKDGFADLDYFAHFQGKPAVTIQVYRVAEQSALKVANAAKEYIKKIGPTLPEGVKLGYLGDQSTILKDRLELLFRNMMMGLVLVVIILGLFMDMRLSFWVTLGIPISFAGGLMLLPQLDVSINMISLFAFIMVLGIVVDDAIVVGENVYRFHEKGLNGIQAAVEGTLEVGRPVIFSVLTTMAAFFPLLTVGGFMGKVARNIPIVVILVLLMSLIESLFILPAHLAASKSINKSGHKGPGGEKRTSKWLKAFVAGPYARLVVFCVQWRYATLAFGFGLMFLTFGVWQAGWIKFTFMPKVEGDTMECLITLPTGSPVDQTFEVVKHYEKAAKDMLAEVDKNRPQDSPSVFEHSASIVGMHLVQGGSDDSGGHLAQIWIQLLDAEQRNISSTELLNKWREKAGVLPNVESVNFASQLRSAGNAIEVHLSMDDEEQLLSAVEALKEELKDYPGVFDITDSFLPGKQEMQLKLKPAASSLGLTLNDLARQVRHAFYGAEALRLQREKDEVKVLVLYPESERKSLSNAEEMRIRTSTGVEVPFGEVAEIEMNQGYAIIQRAQRQRIIKVSADINEQVVNANEVRAFLQGNYLQQLKGRYPGLRYTMEGEAREQSEAFGDIGRGFAFALMAIYALLAIPFKSFTQPFVIMMAIPFGIIGAVFGHLVLGYDLSFMSLMGVVGLSGVVVNDSLVLVDRSNRNREDGLAAREAVIEAGQTRFRAVLLTSLTTFGGLVPILLEKSIQAKFMIPMAISLGFGVLFATGITLLIIPCLYMILEDFHDFRKVLGWVRVE